MLSTRDAEVLLRTHIEIAKSQSSWWQVALRAALTWLLQRLPDLLPLILASSQIQGVQLDEDAATLARTVGQRRSNK